MPDPKKTVSFMSEPFGDKPVTKLAGISRVMGKRLSDKGYDKAYVLLGQYLILKKNKKRFVKWMKNEVNCGPKKANECFACLNEWCEQLL